jgi:hypothetical protein
MTGFKLGRAARLFTAIAAVAAIGAAFAPAGASAATTDYVCASGCPYTTIQSAIDAAGTGDTILVYPGVYKETLDVSTSVTIEGLGTGSTIIEADPATLTDAFTLNLGALTDYPIVYAAAPNVTIEDLTVDGLDDGNAVAGRFEGIAEHNDNLTVNDVNVIGVSDSPPDSVQTGYGIYAVNDGATHRTVTVTNSTVSDYQKAAITADGNSDLAVDIAGNTVVGDGPEAISGSGIEVDDLKWEASPPAGPTGSVTNNTVTANICTLTGGSCGSDLLGDGATSDNNISGDSAGLRLGNVSDLTVSGNDVSDNQIGVFSTTAAGAATTISGNTLAGNIYADVLAGYGTSTVTANTIGTGPNSAAGVDGVLVAGYDADQTAANATITANTITGTDAGVEVAVGETVGATAPTAMIAGNAITGNTQGIENRTSAAVNAVDNWFGCNGGPGAAGCDTITGSGAAHVDATPYLLLTLSGLPQSITPGSTATVVASIRQDSAGNSFPSGPFAGALPVTFATSSGSIDLSATLVNGRATTTLSGTPLGSAIVTGTLAGQSATTTVTTANPVSTTSSTAPTTITVTVPASVPPLIAFLSSGKLSLLSSNPGSELTLTCVDGCSASVSGRITLREKHAKHKTLTLSAGQLTLAANGSSVYAVSLTTAQRNLVNHAVSATLTLSVSARDDTSGGTVTGSKSFTLTRS